jgi:hypothetical protein
LTTTHRLSERWLGLRGYAFNDRCAAQAARIARAETGKQAGQSGDAD